MAEHYDIAIVGGGIIGATLANRLASIHSGQLNIALIDAKLPAMVEPQSLNPVPEFDLRVVALSAASQTLMQALEVWQHMSSYACPYREMEVWDEEGTGNIHFDCADIHEPALGYIIENRVIVSALYSRLKQFANVRILNSTVTELNTSQNNQPQDSIKSTLVFKDNKIIDADLVVAADGARSQLRQWMEFATREWDYDHTAIVTTVKTTEPHRYTAWQCFSTNGPVAFLPLTDEYHCSIVWSLKTSVAEAILALGDEAFCSNITRALQGKLGKVIQTDKRLSFPLRQRHSKRYVKPGLVLLGDAAHTVHPLAGQGANLGLYDVDVLAQEIARGCERHLALNEPSILHRFERQRMPHNLMAMATMEGFKQLFGAENLALRWIRNTGMKILNQQPIIKNQLAKIASGKLSDKLNDT